MTPTFRIRGPKGGTLIRRATAKRVANALPKLVSKFKRVTVSAAGPAPVAKAPARVHALQQALSQIGVRESPAGSNRVRYSTWYGLVGPWCAMFASWCYTQGGRALHYAYVPSIVADARNGRNGLLIADRGVVEPGDLVCYDWPGESKGLADHVGIFEKWVVHGSSFTAIEGNTAVGNNSNGGEVMRRQRSVNDVQAFVRVT